MKFVSHLLISIFVSVFVLAAVSAVAEDEANNILPVGGLSFVDQIDVTVVNIDVYVRDKKGEPVEGLTAEDFILKQDSVRMPISNFAAMTKSVFQDIYHDKIVPQGEEAPPVGHEILSKDVKPIWVVIYIDNENIHPMKRNRVLRRVREFVSDNLSDPAQIMVVSYQRSLRILQPFTSDPVAVNNALRQLKDYTGGRLDRDSARQAVVDKLREEEQRDYGSKNRNTRDTTMNRMFQEVISFAKEEANILSFSLGSLRQIIEMLSGLEGRKSLIYVSSGLPMSPGLGLMHEYSIQFHDNSILSRRSQYDQSGAFKSLTTAANSQGITLYTIDAEGLETTAGTSAEDRYSADPTASSVGMNNYQASLRYMARRTGGIAIVNTNDVTEGLGHIRDDLFSFYSIGYTASATGKDAIHKIDVAIPGHKDYVVRFREKYVEKSLETRVQDRVMSSLLFDVDDNPLQLRLEPQNALPGTGDRWIMPMKISFPLRKLALAPIADDLIGHAILFIAVRDSEGKESEVQRQEHEIRIRADQYDSSASQRYSIDIRMLMVEGHHRVVVGMLDPITRNVSYSRTKVNIP